MMKKWIMTVVTCVALLAPALARAHEGHIHRALGTVSGIDGQRVAMTTNDGKSVTIVLDKATSITRGDDTLDAAALKVGERVSVDYMQEKGVNVARAVKLATASPASKK